MLSSQNNCATVFMCLLLQRIKEVFTFQEDLRVVTTQDLDVSMASYVQFTFHYGCQYHQFDWPREYAVLLQYSNNGGIMWSLLKEIHYVDYTKPR